MAELCKICRGRPDGYRCGMCGARPIAIPDNELCRLCGGHPIGYDCGLCGKPSNTNPSDGRELCKLCGGRPVDYDCGLCGRPPKTRPSDQPCRLCQGQPIGYRCGYCGATPMEATQLALCPSCGNNPPNHGCDSCGARPKTPRPDGVFWVCKHGVFDRVRPCVQCSPEVREKADGHLKPSEACKSCLSTSKGYCCLLCGERSGGMEHTNTSST